MDPLVCSKILIEEISQGIPKRPGSCRPLGLNIDQDWINETRDLEIFEDGDFPALGPNYERQTQAHHKLEAEFYPRTG